MQNIEYNVFTNNISLILNNHPITNLNKTVNT